MVDYLTREDIDNFGSDLAGFSMRAASQAIAPHLQAIQQANAQLHQRLAIEARHRLDAEVAAAVPDYRTIDRDPNWHRFLLSYDPLSGCPRQRLLNDAIARGDGPRVISFFKSFLAQEGQASHHTPGRSRQGAPAAPRAPQAGTHVYTRPEIAKLYESHRRGDFKNREDTWNAIESDIIAATREGRVNAFQYITK